MQKKVNIKKILIISGLIMFFAGVGIILSPFILQNVNDNDIKNKMNDFEQKVQFINNQENGENENLPTAEDTTEEVLQKENVVHPTLEELEALYQAMLKYNKGLAENGQGVKDPFDFELGSFNLSDYGISDGVFGYISAPTVGMLQPIYMGANEKNMYLGACNLMQTSAPIGGNNTNAAFATHTGLINKVMFDNVTKLKKGDEIIIKSYFGTLTYSVIDYYIVLPNDGKSLFIEQGKDKITLITCYPYGYSDKRYIVIAERIS